LRKAIFIDRDGVINNPNSNYYVYKKADFELNKGVIKRLKEYSEAGFQLIIITNQGGVSKGEYSRGDVEILHNYMLSIFEENKIQISEIYYCPHHDSFENCLCRKPHPLMIEKGLARYSINRNTAVMDWGFA